MVKQTIILRKRANPKVVNLPNGRYFTSRWERISRKQLPINIRVKKQRTIGPRRNNRMIYLNQAAPALKRIKKGRRASKIKNKNVRRAMRSDIANMVVQEAQNRGKNKYNSLFD